MRNWTEIEALYVAGDMSQRELAESLGISYSTLSKVATEKKWSAKRRKEREKVAKASLGRARARNARKLDKLIAATEKAMDTALKALEDDDQFRRWIVTEGHGEGVSETSEKVFDKIDTKALKDLAGTLRDLTALARDFYGIKTPGQTVAEKIARERLEMEKRKTDAAVRAAEAKIRQQEELGTPAEIRVEMEDEMKELSE